jgi:polysaccharide deacetylase 2 family uncharacterized protein YibQ
MMQMGSNARGPIECGRRVRIVIGGASLHTTNLNIVREDARVTLARLEHHAEVIQEANYHNQAVLWDGILEMVLFRAPVQP